MTTDNNGAATLLLPRDLTPVDIEDFGEWFQLILRSLHREMAVKQFNALTADDAKRLVESSPKLDAVPGDVA